MQVDLDVSTRIDTRHFFWGSKQERRATQASALSLLSPVPTRKAKINSNRFSINLLLLQVTGYRTDTQIQENNDSDDR